MIAARTSPRPRFGPRPNMGGPKPGPNPPSPRPARPRPPPRPRGPPGAPPKRSNRSPGPGKSAPDRGPVVVSSNRLCPCIRSFSSVLISGRPDADAIGFLGGQRPLTLYNDISRYSLCQASGLIPPLPPGRNGMSGDGAIEGWTGGGRPEAVVQVVTAGADGVGLAPSVPVTRSQPVGSCRHTVPRAARSGTPRRSPCRGPTARPARCPRCPRCPRCRARGGSPQLHETLVEGVGDDVVVVVARGERAVEEGLHLEGRAHAAQFEVAEPQLATGQSGILTETVEVIGLPFSHAVLHRAEGRARLEAGGSSR